MSLKHLIAALVSLFAMFFVACGPAPGVSTGDHCNPDSYADRCTDGVLLVCASGSDCIHHDCSGWGCECYEYPHIRRTDCSDRGQRCVVDKDHASCE